MTAIDRLANTGYYVLIYKDINGTIHVQFDEAEVKSGCSMLIGASGSGKTVEEAAERYMDFVSGKTLVFDAMDKEKRREVVVL